MAAVPSDQARSAAQTAARRGVVKREGGGGWGLLILTGVTTLVVGLVLVGVFGLSVAVIGIKSVDGAGGLIDIFSRDLPPPEAAFDPNISKSTFIYDRNGQELYEIFDPSGGRRTIIPLSEMPQHLIAATLATEDANFYQNPGFDVKAIFRALYQNFRGQSVLSGASTITQQLIRNALFDPEERYDRSLQRKVKEIVLAYRLSQTYSKDEILERYLNEIDYGNLASGIEAASRTYFDKPAKDLNLAEASLLAGLPQAPSDFDPFTNFRAAKERQAEVLGLMVRQGYITEDTAEAAFRQELKLGSGRTSILAPHFVMYVRQMLEKKYGRNRLFTAGFRVYTTLDMKVQRAAEDAVQEHLQRIKDYNATDAAAVAINPNSGEILAMVGSADYWNKDIAGQVNMATAERNPGSTLKPITYATAFSKGSLSPGSIILDEPVTFRGAGGEPYQPKNPDGRFHGPVTARYALANSLNVAAIKVVNDVGVQAMIDLAHRLGITSLNDPRKYGLTVTLGAGPVKLVDLVYAYTAFANGGLQVGTPTNDPKPGMREFEPAAILKIVDADGRVIEEYSPPAGKRVLSPQVAFMVSDILSDDDVRVDTYGRNSPLNIGRPAAAKTGTTDDYEDSWTVGYTPDLVVGVWVGNANNAPMRQILGVSGAGTIWHNMMQQALKDVAPRPFPRPPGLVQVAIDPKTGLRPAPGGPSQPDWFLESNVPTRWTVPPTTATATLAPVRQLPTATPAPTRPTAIPTIDLTAIASSLRPVSTPVAPTPQQQPAAQAVAPPPPTPTPQLGGPGGAPQAQPQADLVVVPSVLGLAEASGRQAIDAAGLRNSFTNYQTVNDVSDKASFQKFAPGTIVSQTPGAGARVARGTIVYIAVRKS